MDFMSIVMPMSLTFIEECHGFHVNSHVIVTNLYWRVSWILWLYSCQCHWPLLKSVMDFMSIVMSLSLTFIEECHWFHVNSHVIVTNLYWRVSWILWLYSCQCHWPLLKSVMDFMSLIAMSMSLTFIEECHGFHVNSHAIVTDLYWRVSWILWLYSCQCHWPLLKSVMDFMSLIAMSMSLTFIEECHWFHVKSHVHVTDLYWRKSWI